MTPAEKFLNEIAKDLGTQPGYKIEEEVFFTLRYAKSRSVAVKNTEIARNEMPKYLGEADYETSISTTSQTVRRAIVNKYKEEMTADGVDVNILLNGQVGQGGIWRDAYNWLWQYKYPRWLEAHSWELLREKATSPANWIQFLTGEMADLKKSRGPYLKDEEPEPEIPQIIPVNEKLWIAIDLEYPHCQFLLFNRSEAGVVLLCPSFGYAPNPIIDKPPLLLPQRDSFAEQTKQKFRFNDKGQEEFLGIVLAKPLNLPWLIPQRQEKIPKWNNQRIKELFEQLETQNNWQVFYQSFEVVELDNP